ncbi:MAG: HlyD family secretion protein [Bacteroidaceae bacterium]|nr:HlyD family secretion protein [Bacteroidaceae bacterium]
MNKKNIKRIYNAVIIAAIILALGYVCTRFIHFGRVEYTDDAQVWRHITPLNARVGGFIKEIRFEDYQTVHQGDTLVIIEDAEYRLQLAQAEAQLKGSQSGSQAVSAGMNTTASNVRVAAAGIEEARVNMENARADYERFATLLEKDAVTRQQYDNARARYEASRARYEQASQQQRSTALVQSEQAERLSQTHAGTSVAEAAVNLARLNLSYTVIVATADGVMSRKDIHVGQLVQPGQQLASIVSDKEVWVVANYRETQMKNIAPGHQVSIKADAIPDLIFQGEVEAVSGGTGSAFSQIPVDNATGNFVKVEQRVPVRIRLTAQNKPEDVARLLAGLNVETEVKY